MPTNPLERNKPINPLYQNTEAKTDTQPTPPAQHDEPEPTIKQRVRTSKRFDERYDQFTSYIDRRFQQSFTDLLDALGNTNKTDLFNEAVYDLFRKYQDLLQEQGIDVEKLPRYPTRPRL